MSEIAYIVSNLQQTSIILDKQNPILVLSCFYFLELSTILLLN